MNNEQWFYQLQGREFGPIQSSELIGLLEAKQLGSETPVRPHTESEWIPLHELQDNALTEASAMDIDDMLVDADLPAADLPDIDDIAFGDSGATSAKQASQWFCRVLGSELGPFQFDELAEMAQDERLSPQDEVRRSNDSKWSAAESIVGLFDGVPKQRAEIGKPHFSMPTVSPQRMKPVERRPAEPAKVEEEEAIWFYESQGKKVGPVPFSHLQALSKAGKIQAGDRIRFEGSGGWMPAEDVNGLEVSQRPQPAAPVIAPAAPREVTKPEPKLSESPTRVSQIDSPTTRPTPRSEPTPPRPAATNSPYGGSSAFNSSSPAFSAARPTPPRPIAPPRPTRSSGPSFSIGDLFSGFEFDVKMLIPVAVLVLGAIGWFGLPMLGSLGDHKYYVQTLEIYEKLQQAGDQATSVAQQLQPQIDTLKAEIEAQAGASRPKLRILLNCYRHYFPRIASGTAEERAHNLAQAKASLDSVRDFK